MKIARALTSGGYALDPRAWRVPAKGEHPSIAFIVANPGVDIEAKDGWLVVRIEGEQDTYVPIGQVLWVEPVTTENRPFVQGPKCVRCGELLEEWNRSKHAPDLCTRRGCGRGE